MNCITPNNILDINHHIIFFILIFKVNNKYPNNILFINPFVGFLSLY